MMTQRDTLTRSQKRTCRDSLTRSLSIQPCAVSLWLGSSQTTCKTWVCLLCTRWWRPMTFLVCSCLYLRWNLGYAKTRRERLRSSKTNDGSMCHLLRSTECPRSRLRFGWRYTTCSLARTPTGSTKLPHLESQTYWDSGSTWRSLSLTSCLCYLTYWEL